MTLDQFQCHKTSSSTVSSTAGMSVGQHESSSLTTSLKLTPSRWLASGIRLGLQVDKTFTLPILSKRKSVLKESKKVPLGWALYFWPVQKYLWSQFMKTDTLANLSPDGFDRFMGYFLKVCVTVSWNYRGRCYISHTNSMTPSNLWRFNHSYFDKN